MRVAFYAPMKPPDHPVPSGDRRMARLLMAALAAGGHEVILASRLRSWDDAAVPGRQTRLRRLGERLAARLVRRWQGAPDRPDLWFTYHLYHKAPDWLGPAVADALGIPYVVAEASHAAKRRHGAWAEGFAGAAAALARADAVLAVSAIDAAGLGAAVPAGRLHRLPPFIETAPFAAAIARRDAARARLWRGDPGPWLLAVAMMRPGDKAQSYAVLAESLGRLAGRPWRLALVGDGPLRDEIVSRFPPGRVYDLGRQPLEALPEIDAAADLYVWPAINEAYGLALLEAQAAGLPVVAGRGPGVDDVVRDGVSGRLTAAGNPASFANGLTFLLRHANFRATYAKGARDTTLADHGLGRAADGLDEAVRLAVTRHAGRAGAGAGAG